MAELSENQKKERALLEQQGFHVGDTVRLKDGSIARIQRELKVWNDTLASMYAALAEQTVLEIVGTSGLFPDKEVQALLRYFDAGGNPVYAHCRTRHLEITSRLRQFNISDFQINYSGDDN